ncbi:MAG: hypothetical protein CM1200mP9_07780 [Gammaproteobacteria bacterium]|nr:MAG: hypothetical protein CM1200mP9_07780 [Gammaproteobacteria bacterium]
MTETNLNALNRYVGVNVVLRDRGTGDRGKILQVTDSETGLTAVDLPLSTLFGKPPKVQRAYQTRQNRVHPMQCRKSI